MTAKATQRVFMIMPFARAIARTEAQLTAFFENNVRDPIESLDLQYAYSVHRSGETFDINAEIIRDVCRADIVIADLSGTPPNPNVMYELGMRLAVSNLPVLLIREMHPSNERVFDISGFYTFEYDTLDYTALEKHLRGKIARLESGEEVFVNPVSQIIQGELAKRTATNARLTLAQQRELVIEGLLSLHNVIAGAFGPRGKGALVTVSGTSHLEMRGAAIAANQRSAIGIQSTAMQLSAQAAIEMGEQYGDGTKLPLLLAITLIRECFDLEEIGATASELVSGLEAARDAARESLRALTVTANVAKAVARTAAKAEIDVDVADAMAIAGRRGLITIEIGDEDKSAVEVIKGFSWERGAVNDDFVSECPGSTCIIDHAGVLVSFSKVSGRQLLPLLEAVANAKIPVIIVAPDFDEEALATLITNSMRGSITAIALHPDGTGQRAVNFLRDLALFSGCGFVNSQMGPRLENVRIQDIGTVRRAVVSLHSTQLIDGGGDPERVEQHTRQLEREIELLKGFEREKSQERVARLNAAKVIIRVGGATVAERRVNRYRIESALRAALSTIPNGAVPGAGLALFRAADHVAAAEQGSESQVAGYRALARALREPLQLLLASANAREDILASIGADVKQRAVFDVRQRQLVDALEVGILDPTDQQIRAVELAVDCASRFLQTGSWQ